MLVFSFVALTGEYKAITFKETEIQQHYLPTGIRTIMLANRIRYVCSLKGSSISSLPYRSGITFLDNE